LVLGCSLC